MNVNANGQRREFIGSEPYFAENGEKWHKIIERVGRIREETWCRSVTMVLGFAYPKDERLLNWIAQNGANGERIRDDAARRGTNVHRGIGRLLSGDALKQDHFSPEEWKCLISFCNWYEDQEPEVEAVEEVVYSLRHRVAGQLDLRCTIGGERHVVDFKTGKYLYPVNEVQAQTYAHLRTLMGIPVDKASLVRLNSQHKRKYEFREREYDQGVFVDVFTPALQLWDHEHGDRLEPVIEESPETLALPQVAATKARA